MARPSKRAKTAAAPTVHPDRDEAHTSAVPSAAPPQNFMPFQTGPSLERIPDDVLHEILSHLPTLDDSPEGLVTLVRAPVLRALSRTSRVLRSRCLAMAWRSVGLFGAVVPMHNVMFFKVVGDATKSAMRVLKACPHLLPLIQTVSVVLTRYQASKIVPAVAACLATLPNLTTIQIIHANSQMTTVIKDGFKGTRFPSVRKISLPSSAHEIIRRCPNIEQVTCTYGNGSTIVGSLVHGHCTRVRILKGISAPLARLVKTVPNLEHISVVMGRMKDMKSLASFPILNTIEIVVPVSCKTGKNPRRDPASLSEIAASDVKEARSILKESHSKAEKRVIVMRWCSFWQESQFEFDADERGVTRDVVKVC